MRLIYSSSRTATCVPASNMGFRDFNLSLEEFFSVPEGNADLCRFQLINSSLLFRIPREKSTQKSCPAILSWSRSTLSSAKRDRRRSKRTGEGSFLTTAWTASKTSIYRRSPWCISRVPLAERTWTRRSSSGTSRTTPSWRYRISKTEQKIFPHARSRDAEVNRAHEGLSEGIYARRTIYSKPKRIFTRCKVHLYALSALRKRYLQ